MLAKIRHFVPKSTLFSIYHSIFSSHLTYGCQVWFQAPNTLTNQISTLQNKALRLINFKNKQEHTSPLYKSSQILKIKDHSDLLNCLFTYKCLHSELPLSFENFVTTIDHQYRTRAAVYGSLAILNVNTTLYGLQSIRYRCISTWNSFQRLYSNNRLSNLSKQKLKNVIRSFYLDSYEIKNIKFVSALL